MNLWMNDVYDLSLVDESMLSKFRRVCEFEIIYEYVSPIEILDNHTIRV